MYDESLQAPLHAALIAPLQRGNLPFVNPPLAAAVGRAPDAAAADRGVPRLAGGAAAHAGRGGGRRRARGPVAGAAARTRGVRHGRGAGRPGRDRAPSASACSRSGTGSPRSGLAGAYALWRRDRGFAGGAVLAATAAIAKPHLAIGPGRAPAGLARPPGPRRGGARACVVVVLASLAAVGPAGLAGFAGAVARDAGRWPLASLLGFTGLTGSWLGNGAAAQLLAAAGSVAAVAGCVVLGRRLARDRGALEPCLAAATVLSLLASPHLLSHDMVMLAPVLAWMLAWAAARDGLAAWPGRHGRAVLAGWVVLSLAIAIDLGADSPARPGDWCPGRSWRWPACWCGTSGRGRRAAATVAA